MGITLIFLLACVLIELFAGFRRGILRQALHFVAFAAAAVIAFVNASSIASELLYALNSIDGTTIEAMVAEMKATPEMSAYITADIENFILALDPEIYTCLVAPFSGLVCVFYFTIIFIIFNIIAKFIYLLVRIIFRVGKGQSAATKLPGLVLGAVEGLLFAAILLLPIANIAGIVRDTYDVIAKSEDSEEIMADYEQSVAPFAEDGVLVAIEKAGGRALYDKFCVYEIGDADCNVREELISIFKTVIIDAPALEDADWKSLSEDDKAAINSILDTVGESNYMSTIIAGVLHATFVTVDKGNLPFEIEEPFDDIVYSAISIFSGVTKDTLGEDLDTLKEIYFIFSDDGVLIGMEEGADLTEIFVKRDENGVTTIDKLIDVIESNQRTKVLLTDLTKLSLTLICTNLDIGDDVTEVYENVKESIGDVLAIDKDDYATDAEYKEALADQLDEALYTNDIELEREIVENMADYIGDNYSDVDEISDEEFSYIILNYYNAYLEHQEDTNTP